MKKALKTTKKLLAVLLAVVITAAMSITAFAASTGTITITNATVGNSYTVYKVFDASGDGTNISYTLVDGKTNAPDGFTVDGAGNVTYSGSGTADDLTAADIAAIAAYVTEADIVTTATAESDTVVIEGLANGYYYITTTTGTAVTITSTNPNARVADKNEAPSLDKSITGVSDGSFDADGQNAIAQVGSTVTYTVEIGVANGAENYVFHDTMSTGLSYNDDLVVTVGSDEITEGESTYSTTATAEGDTITVTFDDDWIAAQVGKTITITYTATVTSDALTVDYAYNTASIDYGNNNTVTSEDSPKVYTATITVNKVDGSGNGLAGASFVLATTDDDDNTVYYKLADGVVSWVEDMDDATVLTTTEEDDYTVAFTGLADGEYTLIETVVPDGYNKADDTTITIEAGDYTAENLAQTAKVVNEAGSLLPGTGGMGTTVIYIVGIVLVLGAGIALVVRRRMRAE